MANGLPQGFSIEERQSELPEGFSISDRDQPPLPPGFSVATTQAEQSPSELFRVFVGGIRDAAESVANVVAGARRAVRVVPGVEELNVLGQQMFPRLSEAADQPIPDVPQPETTLGKVGRQLTEFAAVAGPAMKGATVAAGATTAAGRLLAGEAGAVGAGQLVFDPRDPRISNLIQQYPSLQNSVTKFLAADPSDTEVEARLKMALEDAGVGLALGGIFEGLRAFRAGKRQEAVRPVPQSPEVSEEVAKQGETFIDLSTNIDQAKRAGEIPKPTVPTQETLPPNLNTARLETTDDVKDMLVNVSEQHDNFAPARRNVVSHEETRRLADVMGISERQLLDLRKGQALNAHEALSARQALVQSGEELVNLARAAKGGSDEQVFAFQQALTKHAAIQERVSAITAEAGRALNSFAIMAKSTGTKRAQMISELISKSGGRDRTDKLADMVSKLQTPSEISQFTRDAVKPRFMDRVMEVWINSLLSGPQTHFVNMTSNLLTSAWTIPEHLLAAGIGAARKGDKVSFREVASRSYGFLEGIKDGVIAAKKAFVTGEPSDIFLKTEMRQDAIPGLVGKAINLPTRALQSEDELFKTIAYRMELREQAMKTGLERGLKGRDLAKHIQKTLANPSDKLSMKGIDAGRYLTFTSPTGPLASGLITFVNRHPMARFLLPFIRTPTNIIKFAGERSPLGVFSQRYKEAIKQGGGAADIARARLVLGSGIGALFTSMALDGRVTGGGPVDPASRSVWRSENQPYSIKIGDEWVSYNRVEPVGMIAGIGADLADVIREIGSDDPEVAKVIALLGASATQNLTSKTWLKGISDALEAIDKPDSKGEQFVRSFAGTAVPTGVAQIERIQDPMLREARTILDQIKSRLPGYSTELPPRRNPFGEPIVPEGSLGPDWLSSFWTKTPDNNPVAQEMIRLRMGVSKPKRQVFGVELTPQQYDELTMLAGRMATNQARAVINTPLYWDLSQQIGQKAADAKRSEILKDIWSNARKSAREFIAAKYDLGPKIVTEKRKKAGVQ